MLLGRTDVLIAATRKTSFQPSAEVVEVSMIDTEGTVRLDLVLLPTGTITREATAAHGIDRDELQRLDAPHYRDVHTEIAAALAAAAVVLAYDAPLEKRGAAPHRRRLRAGTAGRRLAVRAHRLQRVPRHRRQEGAGAAPLDAAPGRPPRGHSARQAPPARTRRLPHHTEPAGGDRRQPRPPRLRPTAFLRRAQVADDRPNQPRLSPGMLRRRNRSNSGTVNAVAPWPGLRIMPVLMSWTRVGAGESDSAGVRCGGSADSRGGRSPRRHRAPPPPSRPAARRGRRPGWRPVAPRCWRPG